MINKVYWYDIALRLRDYLKAYRTKEGKRLFEYFTDRDDMKIRVGAGNSGEYPALYILFGSEADVKKQAAITSAKIELWVDIFAKGESSADIDYDDMLYRQLYRAENEFIEVLKGFNIHLHQNGFGCNSYVQEILSDGDENAPVVAAHRLVVVIEWAI